MWGNEPPTKEVVINGQLFPVRQNLWDFLNRANDASSPYHGTLWIDAICIDQENVLERGHQVSIMGEIYTNTQFVISWLGANDEEYAEGLDYVSELCEIGPLTPAMTSPSASTYTSWRSLSRSTITSTGHVPG
jgi:hypothetical protein